MQIYGTSPTPSSSVNRANSDIIYSAFFCLILSTALLGPLQTDLGTLWAGER